MREIKFRVWDKEEKRFWYFTLEDVLKRNMNYRGSWDEKILKGEKQRYVGLKDKNRKEIYEGDILKCKLHNGKYENYTIVWNEKDACFDALNKDKSNFMLATIWRISEVIGNIYENEDLL